MKQIKQPKITAQRVRELVDYDPETGVFTWKVRRKNGIEAGDVVRGTVPKGREYRNISLDDHIYKAHRLAWLHVHGVWPDQFIDHKNGDPLDNRLVNLRLASHGQNRANSRPDRDSKTGFKGVTKHGPNRWKAQITIGNRARYIGCFRSPEEANEAYRRAAEAVFGEFARSS